MSCRPQSEAPEISLASPQRPLQSLCVPGLGHKTPVISLPLRESPRPTAGLPTKETEFHTTSETEIETKIGSSQGASLSTSPAPVTRGLARPCPLPPLGCHVSPESSSPSPSSPDVPVFLSDLSAPSLSVSSLIAILFYTVVWLSWGLSVPPPMIREEEGNTKDPPGKEEYKDKERSRSQKGNQSDTGVKNKKTSEPGTCP